MIDYVHITCRIANKVKIYEIIDDDYALTSDYYFNYENFDHALFETPMSPDAMQSRSLNCRNRKSVRKCSFNLKQLFQSRIYFIELNYYCTSSISNVLMKSIKKYYRKR